METVNLRRDAALKGSSIKRSKKLIKCNKEYSACNDSYKSNKSDGSKSFKKKETKEPAAKSQYKMTVNKPKLFQQSIKKFNKGQISKRDTQTQRISLSNQQEKPPNPSHRKTKSLHLPKRKQSNFLGIF